MRRAAVIQSELPKGARAAFERKVSGRIRRDGECAIIEIQPSSARPSITIKAKILRAHQWAYAIYKGDIPVGSCVCHTCDQPRCINPDHLWLGTQADNMADMIAKGRKRSLVGPRRTIQQRGDRNPNARLSESQARELLNLKGTTTTIEAGRQFGVASNHVSNIWSGKRWPHLQTEK